ncbi:MULTISPECIES: folate-binding protein YgfZ [unclassified Sphingopyxis]|uniref:CAF17-like 4Fe-4S cluster assembly/insertion protein YgfZ n=1 Tax=unclassified Sphingopyxis TaxID=2614943 RepID=UPI0007301A1B|nr:MULTISPECIES: folate-binding protein YgfZ [unclassified Sphingopyxis]KTE27881.1 aminomethyltransferase [Sphingopyxis sp. H057]KTE55739.1 aminomethyltransferase [Sphingopyxis sp. H073]KTE57380.1 aminomethyltransferase [Sphingopyxis sp. H071]KTE61467.1 aminomethyltransferase [Sphingopyxis sp. H107]KTE65202.1 aminomethyltransferase [Sphingopyxis sp. H100]
MANTTLNDRALIRLSGEDVRGFLQGLVTNDVSGNLPVWTALLTPQGKVLFDFLIWGDEGDVLIDCEADAAEALAKRLTLYRLRRAITIGREEGLAVHWAKEGDLGVVDPRLSDLGQRWLAPADEGKGADAAWKAHRLSLGVTEGRAELGDGTTLWLECNAAELNGVSFTKGCYVGQENTARMNWRQKVNRRLFVVPVAEADEKRQVVAWPNLGWSVEHRRVEAIAPAAAPYWMREALTAAGS